MWWILAGVAVAAFFDSASNKEKKAARQWEAKKRQVKNTISYQRQQIDHHIRYARFEEEFYKLNNLYYQSRQTANLAYKTYESAQISHDGAWKLLKKVKTKRWELRKELQIIDKKNRNQVKSERISTAKICQELHIYNDAIDKLYDEIKILSTQKNEFLTDLRELNNRTRQLKESIRDRCGNGGRLWYNRLERRKYIG